MQISEIMRGLHAHKARREAEEAREANDLTERLRALREDLYLRIDACEQTRQAAHRRR